MNMLYEGLKEKGALMLIPSSAVESMGMGGMLGAAAMRQQSLVEPGDKKANQAKGPRVPMFILVRALVYATAFMGFVLVAVPARLLSASGLTSPSLAGPVQLAGASLAVAGALVAIACILTFVVIGRGTPAPFDPPRKLVARGPYRFVRNPMYLGAAMAMGGAAIVYRSWLLMGYVAVFLAITHAFVVGYEEPTLRRTFGAAYDDYCRRVSRWWPAFSTVRWVLVLVVVLSAQWPVGASGQAERPGADPSPHQDDS